jgi:adenylate cyclase
MPIVAHWLRARSTVSLIGSTLVFIVVLILRNEGFLQFFELMVYDTVLSLHSRDTNFHTPIVLIGMTESDIQELRKWPLTDAMVAEVLEIAINQGASVIGLDIYRDVSVPPGTEKLNKLLRNNQNIITVTKLATYKDMGIAAAAALSGTDRVGFNDIVLDPAGIVRRGLLFMDDGESLFYSFALRLALSYLETMDIFPQPGTSNPQHLRLGQATLPPLESTDGPYVDVDAAGYQILLDYHGGAEPFKAFSLMDLRSGNLPREALKNKIVIIGVVSESVKDTFYTPLDNRFFSDSLGIPGISMHAYVVNQLLRAAILGVEPPRSFSDKYEAIWILFWGILGGLLGRGVRSAVAFAGLSAIGVLVVSSIAYFAFSLGWWVPTVPPLLAWITSGALTGEYMYSQEKREREALMQIFSRNVSQQVAEKIWKERDRILTGEQLRPQLLTATVLFADIQGFTSISEKLIPQPLIFWLSSYMETMTGLVMNHGGVVDDYAGDGIKADFGIPVPRIDEEEIREDALNAVNCGLAMEEALKNLNEMLYKKGLPKIHSRIGINTGLVTGGSIGSAKRMKYTTIGDAVNVASRLESLRDLPVEADWKTDSYCRILIADATRRYLDSSYKTKYIGRLPVKGKVQHIGVHQVYDRT